MADMSRCCVCENYSFKTGICSKYPNEIPKDIFIELRECKFYKKRSETLHKRRRKLTCSKRKITAPTV